MPSKYARFKGKVPMKPSDDEPGSDRAKRLAVLIVHHKARSIASLGQDLTMLRATKDKIATDLKDVELVIEAVETCILDRLEADEQDAASVGGYTLSGKFEPYPSVDDKPALLQHCLDGELRDSLILPPARLAALVREEAENNELEISTKTVTIDGAEVEVQEARSKSLPGVRVFLKRALSRVKSKASE